MQWPVHLFGKRASRLSVVASAVGYRNSLLLLNDVFPASHLDHKNGKRTSPLIAANGSTIAAYGTRKMSVSLANHDYAWPLILADVRAPLLGADFLQANGLMVDLQSRCLVNATSFTSATLRHSNQPTLSLHHIASDNPFNRILNEFPAITRPEFTSASVRQGVEHFNQTTGPPVQVAT